MIQIFDRASLARLRAAVLAHSLVAIALFGHGAAHAIVSVGSDLHGFYDGCIAKFTAAGLRDEVDQLDRSKNKFTFTRKAGTISNPDDRTRAQDGSGTGGETYINPTDTSPLAGEAPGVNLDPCATLYHEMRHLVDYDNGTNDSRECVGTGGISIKEVEATRAENRYRATQPDLKNHLRTNYGPGTQLPPDGAPCQPGTAPVERPPGGCNVSAVGLPTCGVSNGDPHLATFDQVHYDFQAVGEFIAVKSTDKDDLEIQVRQQQMKSSSDASVNTAVAMNVAGDFVGLFMTARGPEMHINGKEYPIAQRPLLLAGRGVVRRLDTDELSVMWPDGSEALLYQIGPYGFRLGVNLAKSRRGTVQGLLGNFDGRPENDLRLRSGELLKGATFADLYPRFSDSWRISQAESLFQYGRGQTTRTFTDRRLPTHPIVAAGLANRESAERVCREAGIQDPILLQDCTLDVGISGRADFAKSASDTERVFFRRVKASPAATPHALEFSGKVSGTLQSVETDCTLLSSSQGFALHIVGTIARDRLELFVNLTGGFHGPGEYPLGSVLANSGQASLSYRGASLSTSGEHAGKLRVNPDGRSGNLSATLGSVAVVGGWACDQWSQ